MLRRLPCGHEATLQCHVVPAEAVCKAACPRHPLGGCEHACPLACGEACPAACPVLVDKVVSSCPRRHTVKRACSSAPPTEPCPERCGEKLPCGHDCPSLCSDCTVLGAGGAAGGDGGSERLHAPCSYECSRRLLCAHDCAARHPCSEPCPPCAKKCETRCEHSTCALPCGAPCVPCTEPCRVRCAHSACRSLCGAPCERAACNVPCPKALACGHACIGLCGEPCPTQCRVCDGPTNGGYRDTLTLTDLRDAEPGDRFVQLQDCGHTFEAEVLDGWMATQDISRPAPAAAAAAAGAADDAAAEGAGAGHALQLPVCPGCRVPVRRSFRYSGLVRRCLLEIEEVKRRNWVGPELRAVVLAALQRVADRVRGRSAAAAAVEQRRALSEQLRRLEARAREHPRAATVQLLLGELKLREPIAAAANAGAAVGAAAGAAADGPRGIAERHLDECLRLVAFTRDGKPDDSPSGPSCNPPLTLRRRAGQAHLALLHLGLAAAHVPETSHVARLRLEGSARAAALAGVALEFDIDAALKDVDAAERALVERAMQGVERGSWHACPNGHRYLIGECGGAMQQSRCPDCRADVGGGNHALTAGNRALGPTPWDRAQGHAPDALFIQRVQRGELDGAPH